MMQHTLSLGHAEAQQAIEAIEAEAHRRGKPVTIAVADAHGELIALLRLDGAPLASVVIATSKAWTAARERRPTYEIGQRSRHPETGFDLANYGDPGYVGWGGGLPVRVNGAVVGAVAVSGLTQQEDIELAQVGVDALQRDERAATGEKTLPMHVIVARQQYPRAYERWNEEEDDRLRGLYADGVNIETLASLLQRQPSAVRARLAKLGLLPRT
jgi:glc operon protein GlcG